MPHSALEKILQLDPVADHQQIVFLMSAYEFPFDTTRSLEFALFRTFAVPSIGKLLCQTGEFNQRAQKRYDDTDLIISEIYEHGYDSERGRRALKRMNHLHGRYDISNDDFLYVLTTFIYEPIRWIERFGWRPLSEHERLAAFHFWRAMGRRMNIKHIPESYHELAQFNRAYERAHFRYTEESRQVADATCALFLNWFLPPPLHWLGAPALYALMDDPLLEAFRYPKPSPLVRGLLTNALRLRGRLVRLLPERRRPRIRTQMPHRSYPQGYQIEQLGPNI